MAWKITVGERSMMLDDISPDEFMTVVRAKRVLPNGLEVPKYPDLTWLRLYTSPAGDPEAFYDLVALVARKMEVPSPDRPANMREAVAFLTHVEAVDDDLPKEFSDAGLPLVEDETTTSTSRTSTASTPGTPSRPGARP